ncbi:UNVERIFIED_CONTAM: hypothetical protein Slati_1644300 [Sesamum latifolium]|uniref:Endonuclease/exonuclease/phosphatase domain-containing protein n=1 Tax=Sesamum latifolium TaxID=2727402 RepID=A0AAW2XAR5_9LAMI
MSLLVWNCQGLGNPWTVKGFGDLLRNHKPTLVFLVETKCFASQVEALKRKFNLFGCGVDPIGRSGGLALFWHKSAEVQLQSLSRYHIDVSVRLCDKEEWWRFTGFYGEPDVGKREVSWNLLRRLHSQSIRPWLCAGDFNEILEHAEKEGGSVRAEWQIRNFRKCLSDCELQDLGFQGPIFTWCNNHREPNTVRERLDRACSSLSWSHLFPASKVNHVSSPYSDHAPLVIELRPQAACVVQKSQKIFRFEASWLQEADCEALVTSAWTVPAGSHPKNVLVDKISTVCARLSRWGRLVGKETVERIKALKKTIVSMRQHTVTEDSRARELKAKDELLN